MAGPGLHACVRAEKRHSTAQHDLFVSSIVSFISGLDEALAGTRNLKMEIGRIEEQPLLLSPLKGENTLAGHLDGSVEHVKGIV